MIVLSFTQLLLLQFSVAAVATLTITPTSYLPIKTKTKTKRQARARTSPIVAFGIFHRSHSHPSLHLPSRSCSSSLLVSSSVSLLNEISSKPKLNILFRSAVSSNLGLCEHNNSQSEPITDHNNNNNNLIEQETQPKQQRRSTVPWIACSSAKDVARAVRRHVRRGDVVVELGSQLREASTAICLAFGDDSDDSDGTDTDGMALLVDVERKFPKLDSTNNTNTNKMKDKDRNSKRISAMRRKGDDIDFFTDRAAFREISTFARWRDVVFFRDWTKEVSPLNDAVAASLTTTMLPKYNVLVADVAAVAGNDLDLTCISLVTEFLSLNGHSSDCHNSNGSSTHNSNDCLNLNPCHTVILKSRTLNALSRRLFHAAKLRHQPSSLHTVVNRGTTAIVGTVGVKEYRQTIPLVVRPGDAVLEVGCHFGTTTALLHAAARGEEDPNTDTDTDTDLFTELEFRGGCLGIDIGPRIIDGAKERYPHVPFAVGDAWHTAELQRMKYRHLVTQTTHPTHGNTHTHGDGYDVVYVDIGGLSGSDGLLESISLLKALTSALEPRCIVIKSLCVRRLASSLVPFRE